MGAFLAIGAARPRPFAFVIMLFWFCLAAQTAWGQGRSDVPPSKRLATIDQAKDQIYRSLMDYLLPRMKTDGGQAKGQFFDYRGRKGEKALAACVDWDAHLKSRFSDQAAGDAAGLKYWHGTTAKSSLEEARSIALQNCAKNESTKPCTCHLLDENDKNVFAVPTFVARRVLVDGNAHAAPAPDPAAIRQKAYERIMEITLSRKITGGTGLGQAYVGKQNDYRNKSNGKAMAVCIDWSGRTINSIRTGGSNFSWASDHAPRMQSIRESALQGCAKNEANRCRCQIVDENDRNVLQVPDDFIGRVAESSG